MNSSKSTQTLNPQLKHFIQSRAKLPNLTQSHQFAHRLSQLLKEFDGTAKRQRLRSDSWIIFSTATLVTLNRPSAFQPYWTSISRDFCQAESIRYHEKSEASSPSEDDDDDQIIRFLQLIRETGLKTISFSGLPKTINALNHLRDIWNKSSHHQIVKFLSEEETGGLLGRMNQDDSSSMRKPTKRSIERVYNTSTRDIYQRGLQLWNSIYGNLSEKLLNKLFHSHPDLPEHILLSHYGHLLSEPCTTQLLQEEEKVGSHPILGRLSTSLVAMGALRSVDGLAPQLLSHTYGLRRSLTGEDSSQVYQQAKVGLGEGCEWLVTDEGVEWILGSIDHLTRLIRLTELELESAPLPHSPKL